MDGQKLLQCEDYDPNRFVDWMRDAAGCRNDADLARALGVAPPVLSKIRHRRLPVGDSMLVRVSDYTGMSTLQIKQHLFRAEAQS